MSHLPAQLAQSFNFSWLQQDEGPIARLALLTFRDPEED